MAKRSRRQWTKSQKTNAQNRIFESMSMRGLSLAGVIALALGACAALPPSPVDVAMRSQKNAGLGDVCGGFDGSWYRAAQRLALNTALFAVIPDPDNSRVVSDIAKACSPDGKTAPVCGRVVHMNRFGYIDNSITFLAVFNMMDVIELPKIHTDNRSIGACYANH